MMSEELLRQLLIDSCHSSKQADEELLKNLSSQEFVALLVKIALDEDDYEGDAPMQAAYFLSKAPVERTKPFENQVLRLLPVASDSGYGGHVALTLGRMKSAEAKAILKAELSDGTRFDAWLFEEALKQYEG